MDHAVVNDNNKTNLKKNLFEKISQFFYFN